MGLRDAEKSITYKTPYKKVFEAVKKALVDCSFRVKEIDEKGGSIKASVGISIWSWGEDIDLLVSKVADGTRVDVYSGAKAQIIDWGKSSKNIMNFFTALNKRLNE